jgi:hypothetical protein
MKIKIYAFGLSCAVLLCACSEDAEKRDKRGLPSHGDENTEGLPLTDEEHESLIRSDLDGSFVDCSGRRFVLLGECFDSAQVTVSGSEFSVDVESAQKTVKFLRIDEPLPEFWHGRVSVYSYMGGKMLSTKAREEKLWNENFRSILAGYSRDIQVTNQSGESFGTHGEYPVALTLRFIHKETRKPATVLDVKLNLCNSIFESPVTYGALDRTCGADFLSPDGSTLQTEFGTVTFHWTDDLERLEDRRLMRLKLDTSSRWDVRHGGGL